MIALVTDSTAGLTQAEARSWNVLVAPHSYSLNGNYYTETYAGENGAYPQALRHSLARATLQASEDVFYCLFRHLQKQGMEILCPVISARLSGAYSAAATAAARLGGGIAVVDSQLTAGGLYLLVSRLRQEIDQNGLTLAEAAAACEEWKRRISVTFSVAKMDALRKSRRIGVVRQSVNAMLNRRPVLLLQRGSVASCGLARGWREEKRLFLNLVPQNAGRVVVQYFEQKENAAELAAELKQELRVPCILLREIGPVLSIHIGEDALAVSWETPVPEQKK